MLQHILNKNPISSGTVLHENMGDGPYEFTVLDDRCTAHSLDDSSGQGDQVRICDFQFDSPVHVVMIEMNVGDLDIIVSGGAVYGTFRISCFNPMGIASSVPSASALSLHLPKIPRTLLPVISPRILSSE